MEYKMFSGPHSLRKLLLLTISLLIMSFLPVVLYAQVNPIKELKKNTQLLKNKMAIISPGDPWTIADIITPEELSKELANPKTKKPVIYNIGFDFLYQQSHIPGSIFAGPASRQDGIDKIKTVLKAVKHDQKIVIYCGCCPWKECPNIRQGYKIFKNLGYNSVKVLYIPDNFAKDWKDKGYAVENRSSGSTSQQKR
jgi:thiosulfate/3-mercaptopyruvate sulfurtransferase